MDETGHDVLNEGIPYDLNELQCNFNWQSSSFAILQLTLVWLSLAACRCFSSLTLSIFSRWKRGSPAPMTSGSGSSWIDACGDMVDETWVCGGETTVVCLTARASSRSYIDHVQTRFLFVCTKTKKFSFNLNLFLAI